MGVALNATTSTTTLFENVTTTDCPSFDPELSERERLRMEFYQTYDVMTGVRIAVTLGSFFTMMVLLVLYKSKCKSRANESLEAAITAVVAEEEELEAVLSQSKYDFKIGGPRQSLGNMSAPAYTRFSSVCGYGGFMNPPSQRYDRGTKGRTSLPASDISFRYFTSAPTSVSSQERSSHLWKSYDEEEENDLKEVEETEEADDVKCLQVPNSRHKFNSNSTTVSPLYFEKRGSFCSRAEHFPLEKERGLKPSNHPNIRIIQATPQISPSESNSGLQEDHLMKRDNHANQPERRLAPLASIGSCSAISSIESENRSLGSDSVFMNSGTVDEDDTDKDQNEEELSSTKSDHQDCTNKKYRILPSPSTWNCFVISGNRIQSRRFSDSGTLNTNLDKAKVLPIVTNLTGNTNNQITTCLYNRKRSADSSSSGTSLSSNFSGCSSTSSSKRTKGVLSRIAIIDVNATPIKTDYSKKIKTKSKSLLSKSEPKTINMFTRGESSAKDMKTLSLKNLMNSSFWSKETLF